jgi:hypothetical protein
VSNVSFSAKLADEIPGVKVLGGAHNGAMSPHFSPATMTAFIDDAPATNERPIDLVVTFESIGPNAIAVLGHRSISVIAWKKAEPVAVAKPKAEKAAKSAPIAKAEKTPAPEKVPEKLPEKPKIRTPAPEPVAAAARKELAPKAKPAPQPAPVAAAPVLPAPVVAAPPKSAKPSISAVKPEAASKSAPAKASPAKPAAPKAASAKRK